jgi:hypothetical protein
MSMKNKIFWTQRPFRSSGHFSKQGSHHPDSIDRLVDAKLLPALPSTVIFGAEPHGAHDHVLISETSGNLQNHLDSDSDSC